MKIWIFNHYAHPPNLPGGTRHHDLALELVRRGHRVTIFATSFHHQLRRETRLQPGEDWKIEDVNGVQFVWIRTPSYQHNDWRRVRNMVAFMLRAWRLGQKLPKLMPEIGRPNVVIGSSPDLLTPLAACLVARLFRVPFVVEVRDLWPQTIIDMGVLSPKHPIVMSLQALERFLYQRAECIITLLPLAHEYITACGILREKIIWVPNGVDISRFKDAPPESVNHEGFQMIYLGAHGRANAIDVLIQAAKIVLDRGLHEIRFVLIGDGPEKPRLTELAKELGLANVEFRNPIPKTEVPNALCEADSFLFNLEDVSVFIYGISPNKLFDYMAAGKPVITSVEAPDNLVEKARCGLMVPPRDPEALAEAIIKIYEMPPEEREAMGRRGREYVAEHHSISRLAGLMEHTLREIPAVDDDGAVHPVAGSDREDMASQTKHN
jgi:glycosyltransferase involved in cell wall biosynthesis